MAYIHIFVADSETPPPEIYPSLFGALVHIYIKWKHLFSTKRIRQNKDIHRHPNTHLQYFWKTN